LDAFYEAIELPKIHFLSKFSYIEKFNVFNGISICWFYPGCWKSHCYDPIANV